MHRAHRVSTVTPAWRPASECMVEDRFETAGVFPYGHDPPTGHINDSTAGVAGRRYPCERSSDPPPRHDAGALKGAV